LQQWRLTPFATQAAQAATLHLSPTPLENLDTLLTESGLSPKRQAQQVELDRFLDQIKTELTSALPLNARNAFISYAWEPNAKDLSRQQRHLRQLAHDLGRAGFPTWLDIERMTGDINAQMAQNIQNSRYALIIGTPRYTQRATVLLNGQPTNVKREYDDILKGHQEKKLEVLALTFLPPGPFDGGKKDETGKIDYPSFPETMPALPQFDLLNIDEVETYLHCLTDEQHGLLPQLLHLAERSPEERALYQTAKASLKERLQLLPAEHLILAQAEHDQRIYEIEERRKLYIEARAKAEEKEASPEFNLTAQFDAFLSRIAAPVQAKENAAEAAGEGEEKDASQVEKAAESKDELVSMMQATTFLALGSGGSGKSLFAQIQYARLVEPWLAYKKDPETHPRPAWIPVYIPLKHYVGKWEATPENQAAGRAGQPRVNTCVETALRETYRLDERDIEALKTGSGQSLGVLLILDGYDELSGETPHLYNLNGLARWSCPLKLLVTSRIDYIPDPEKHKGYFAIGSQTDSFVRSYIQPFSFDDIERYIQLYESQILIQQSQAQAARDAASGVLAPAAAPQGDTYQTLEKLPGLLGLVKNPFLLNLVLQGLPYLVAQRAAKEDSRSVTRFAIYDSFSQYWFGKEVFRLVKQDDPALRLQFEQHAERLAFQLFLNQQLSVSEKGPQDADLWGQFFNAADSEVAKARAALPIRDAGDQQYEFMHKTLFEYFVARHFVNAYDRAIAGQPHPNPVALGEALAARPSKDKARHAGGVPLPVQDGGVFNFLKDAIETGGGERNFKVALFEQVKRSATLEGQAEPEIGGPRGLAAAHAATILTKTGTSMANQAWRGVQLPGADLGLASLAHSDLSGTNLKGAYLVGTFLYGADLSRANLKEVRFMEYPKITLQESVRYFALYPSVTARRARPWIVIGQENEIIIIDQNTGEVLGRRESHDDRVNYVAFSPQGDRVVSGSYNTLRFWEVSDTGGDLTPQGVLRGREANVYAYVFSPEGDRMVSRGQANTLCLWSVGRDVTRELMPQAVLQEQENYVTACAFSPTGDRLVSIGQGNTLCLWSVGRDVTGELTPQAVLRGHEDDVTACEFSPRGDRVVSASNDQTLCLWKVEKNASGELTPQAVLRGHEAKVNACAFSPEGDRVVSGSEDGTLRLWSVGDDVAGELSFYAVLRGHGDGVVACAFSPEGDRVMSSSYDATLRWWLAGKGTVGELMPQMVLRGHERAVNACSFNPTGDRMVSGSYDKTLRLWKVTGFPDDFAPQAVLRGQEAWVNACAFSPEGDRVVSGSDDGTLRLWSVEGDAAGELMPQVVLRGHEAEVYACAFSPRDDWVVSASRDTTLRLWKVTEAIGELASSVVLRGHNEGVRACAFSFEGKRLVSASEDQTLRLWRVGRKATETLASYAVLRGHEGGVFACAFSPEGGRVVSGSDDGTLRLWSVEGDAAGELMPQVVLRGHEAGVTACVFSPKGDRVVSSSLYDKTLRVWDVGSISQATCIQVVKWCALITSLDIHPRHYRSMAASSSETCFTGNAKAENSNIIQIVVGDDAGLMSLWQLEDQQVHFRGMPLQPGMTNVWRATWQTVKLAGTQVTNLVKALLEQYRERPLEEGGEENQVQLVAYSSEEETKEEGVRVQSAGAAVAVESASATQSTLEKETCYWVFPTSNKKATAKGILDTLKGLPLDRRPVVNKNCFTSQADAEKQLAFLFEKKSISKGGFCKGFIFCADASAAEFAKLAIGDTEGAKKLFVNVSAYSYNREAKQLTEIEKTSLALEKESVEHSQALACSS
jgi:WD40 repeat protein